MYGLEGKVAVVTGAGRGIGAAIARELAQAKCALAVLDRPGDEASAQLVQELGAVGTKALLVAADVRDFARAEAALAEIHETLGGLDILVCNAGITRDGASWKMPEAAWDAVLDVNLKGVFNYNRAAAAVFKAQGSGKIVNISSINGLRGKFGQVNYAASKGGVIALTKTMARELGKFSVNVNSVAPGMVLTEMAEEIPEAFLEKARAETVLGRLAEPVDVARVVAFLCSELARHITGEVIRVDGGQYI